MLSLWHGLNDWFPLSCSQPSCSQSANSTRTLPYCTEPMTITHVASC